MNNKNNGWVAQVVGASSLHQKVVGSIPGQGISVGYMIYPQSGS